MIFILIAIIVAAAIVWALLNYSTDGYDGRHFVAAVFGIFLGVATGTASVVYAFAGWGWVAAESKANIINREYGTHYTREEIFYASDVIDTIRQINRKRVEVNGDLFREKAKDTDHE